MWHKLLVWLGLSREWKIIGQKWSTFELHRRLGGVEWPGSEETVEALLILERQEFTQAERAYVLQANGTKIAVPALIARHWLEQDRERWNDE